MRDDHGFARLLAAISCTVRNSFSQSASPSAVLGPVEN
jgi:hypothetical protein